METTFTWMGTKGPNEITRLTLDVDTVPHVGEQVDISMMVKFPGGQDERVSKSGRVKDVIWNLSAVRSATVILGA